MEFRQGYVLESSSCSFELENEIGQGTCSVVWKANRQRRNEPRIVSTDREDQIRDTDKGLKVALKIFKKGKQYESSGLNEAKILLDFTRDGCSGNRGIVRLLDCFYHKDIYLCSVYELLDCSLYQILHKAGGCGLPVYVVHRCAIDLFTALTYLQDNKIVHGDIKLSNVMWSGDVGLFKLVDFGLSFIDGKPHQAIQSCGYQAPEVQEWNRQLLLPNVEQLCSKASDVWSVGCVLAYLYMGHPLYDSYVQHPLICLQCQQTGVCDDQQTIGDKLQTNWDDILIALVHCCVPNGCRTEKKNFSLQLVCNHQLETRLEQMENQCAHEAYIKVQLPNVQHGHVRRSSDEQLTAFTDLLSKLMKCKPSERLVPAAALQHPFVTSLPRASLSDLLYLPSRVLQLCNVLNSISELMDAEEIDDIALDIEDECKKYGNVNSIHIPTGEDVIQENFGKVFVEFQRTQDCQQAQKQLMGRTFNQRVVVTSFFPLDDFVKRHFY